MTKATQDRPTARQERGRGGETRALRLAVAVVCGLLGFVLVAQVRATENLGERLAGEREEDLASILADLSAQSDRLQEEITELQLTLFALEDEQQGEEVALRTLQERRDNLRILAGVVPVEGEGLVFRVDDPAHEVGQDLLVDAVQELRDAGAEAIAINGTRLIASSAFVTENDRLLLDGRPLDPPYVVTAIGAGATMSRALAIPGGSIDSLEAFPQVTTTMELLDQLTVPARAAPASFRYAEPVPTSSDEQAG
jgi:uncharacterized protein YlxW (UPF0749 family)